LVDLANLKYSQHPRTVRCGIRGAADEAVLNKVDKKKRKTKNHRVLLTEHDGIVGNLKKTSVTSCKIVEPFQERVI